jgi:undecaprenyl-diphosphatase
MTYFEAFIIAVIEGLTEFLPISSTGHMMIGSALLGIESTPFVKLFTVAIQLGAILSVVILYFKRFFKSFDFYKKLIVAFIPAAIFGFLLGDAVDSLLEKAQYIGFSLFIGGIILLFVDKWFKSNSLNEESDISYIKALGIGLSQCIALIPGVSRSGATIVGGMGLELTRKNAAEFSFFLAVPTMFAATAKKLFDFFKEGHALSDNEINLLVFGNVVAFIVALIAIKSFISILTTYGFKGFGWYRIIVGGILILLFALHIPMAII